ncbi:MAG: lipid-A-disaccharide synthase [Anaerolineae bacterium]|nr:lipid-A-disaccharide synthase [Gloeobacterales cyanobacterium ES-bin-313]
MDDLDVLILSNGPGEVNTWVRPVVAELVQRWPGVRISVILAPDVNSSGREAEMARLLPGVDRVQAASHYIRFLLTGRTAEVWDWRPRGIVLFLGGDQGFSAFIARRLCYPIVAYAEWQVRWPRFFARFGLREDQVRKRSPKETFPGQFQVVGDLMADGMQPTPEGMAQARAQLGITSAETLVALLPGSKPLKLSLGIPLFIGVAEQIQKLRPDVRFYIPVAPGLKGEDLAYYGQPQNRDIALMGGVPCRLERDGSDEWLVTPQGARVQLSYARPAYNLLAASDLALTTVGANTAELGMLGVPMIVVIPTNRLDVMRAWDGLPGLLSNLPGVGSGIATWINKRLSSKLGLLAWPNIRAGRMVVPELREVITASQLAVITEEWLDQPERRQHLHTELQSVMGKRGAAAAFVRLAESVIA